MAGSRLLSSNVPVLQKLPERFHFDITAAGNERSLQYANIHQFLVYVLPQKIEKHYIIKRDIDTIKEQMKIQMETIQAKMNRCFGFFKCCYSTASLDDLSADLCELKNSRKSNALEISAAISEIITAYEKVNEKDKAAYYESSRLKLLNAVTKLETSGHSLNFLTSLEQNQFWISLLKFFKLDGLNPRRDKDTVDLILPELTFRSSGVPRSNS